MLGREDESMAEFIDRMNTEPDKVRAEWEADMLEEHDQEWVDENEEFYDAWWGSILMMHGGSSNGDNLGS